MNASCLTSCLRFEGGKPLLILRDHEEGRIKVFLRGVWIATVVPGRLFRHPEVEAFLISRDLPDGQEIEWGGEYDAIAAGLSELQQTGDWGDASDAVEEASELIEEFSL